MLYAFYSGTGITSIKGHQAPSTDGICPIINPMQMHTSYHRTGAIHSVFYSAEHSSIRIEHEVMAACFTEAGMIHFYCDLKGFNW